MSQPVYLTILVEEPIELSLQLVAPTYVVPTPIPASEPLFVASEAFRFQPGDKAKLDTLAHLLEGERHTGIDAGILGQESITDDYLYKCVRGGEAGVAIWKKIVMFQT